MQGLYSHTKLVLDIVSPDLLRGPTNYLIGTLNIQL